MNRILIIDDDTELCVFVTRFLNNEGFEIDQAANAGQGIEHAPWRSYPLIVLDAMMPDLDSITFA